MTSVCTKSAEGRDEARVVPRLELRSPITMWAPAALRAFTYASPRPDAPPVIIAVLPARLEVLIGVVQSMRPL